MISESFEVITPTRSWPRLQILQLETFEFTSEPMSHTSQIIDGIERGLFPALKTLRYGGVIISSSDLFKIYKKTISVERF